MATEFNCYLYLNKVPKGSFLFKGGHPSHDDYGKTIDDIEKRFFAFNCQKSSIEKFYFKLI
jgi:hypothetical protein